MPLDSSMIEITKHSGPGYRSLVSFGAWRVAVLNYIDDLLPANLKTMQKHDLTEEVFVLLNGRCILFLAEGEDAGGAIHAVDMQPRKAYNIRRGCWHTHTLSRDASVLIVESDDTTNENSPTAPLTETQTSLIIRLTAKLWSPT